MIVGLLEAANPRRDPQRIWYRVEMDIRCAYRGMKRFGRRSFGYWCHAFKWLAGIYFTRMVLLASTIPDITEQGFAVLVGGPFVTMWLLDIGETWGKRRT